MTDTQPSTAKPLTEAQIDQMAETAAAEVMEQLGESLKQNQPDTEPEVDTSGARIFNWFRAVPRAGRRGLVKTTGVAIYGGRKLRKHLTPHIQLREVLAVLVQLAFVMAATALTVSLASWAWTVAPVIATLLLGLITASVIVKAWSIIKMGDELKSFFDSPIVADA